MLQATMTAAPQLIQTAFAEADPVLMTQTFESQQATALRWRESTASERIARIKKLREAMLAHREAFYAAFAQDYRKSVVEVEMTEFLPVLDEIRHILGSLKAWMKPKKVWPTMNMVGTRAWIEFQPRGRCLIIAPWNYPLNLCFGPLVTALAAGNTAIIKPSEMTPAVSAVMAKIIREVFRPDEVALFEGSMPTSQVLLEQPFDHIFFTGSPAVGKVVMGAAAKHLTSVTLELGGKSPTIIDETADIQLAAEVLMWGKLTNCGQTCVAPDYVYVHESIKESFVQACQQVLQKRYGQTAAEQKSNKDLTGVINQRHTQRIGRLLKDAVERGASVRTGGEVDVQACYIAPTLLDNIPADALIMQEEIFGPVLPILPYNNLNSVIHAINAEPKPLALYMWSQNQAHIRAVLQRTSSGSACINHCVMQYAHGNLPFGGVNNSGIGNSHGFYGFKAFSHERAILRSTWFNTVKMFFPPFTPARQKLVRVITEATRLPGL